ncbi:hypothetical protein RHMOL_Rhmol07G0231300 [Rhododendron molle]|nr:hypothetical protein RHMOL_Rhmol07G0231300 [Rhododendron molle]
MMVVAQGATKEKRCKVVLNKRYCDLPSCGYMCDVLYNGTAVCSSPTICLCIYRIAPYPTIPCIPL